jgi:uncharacterized delta-60 repeat protein
MKRITLFVLLLLAPLAHAQQEFLDATFGKDGIAYVISKPYSEFPLDIAVLPDGKILECGMRYDGSNYVFVRRFHPNGLIDSTYGVNGTYNALNIYQTSFAKIVSYPDGSVLVFGQSYSAAFKDDYTPFAVRVTNDGERDTTFADNGVYLEVWEGNVEGFRSALIQTDGTIVIVGMRGDKAARVPVITKLDAFGKRISSFGDDGKLAIDVLPDSSFIADANIDQNGECVFAGSSKVNETHRIVILRTDVNGNPVESFGEKGVVSLSLSDVAVMLNAVKVLSNKNVLCLVDISKDFKKKACVLKLTPSGNYDKSFGDWGTVEYPDKSDARQITDLVVDSNDNIVVAGYGGESYSYATVFQILSDGNTNNHFGDSGEVFIPEKILSENTAVAIQPDGKYLVGGWSYKDVVYSTIIQRIDANKFISVKSIPIAEHIFSLHPTPSTDNCTITYTLPSSGECTMTLRDESGREVRTFANQYRTAGEHKEELDLRGLATGVYFLQIEYNGTIQTAKLIKQ